MARSPERRADQFQIACNVVVREAAYGAVRSRVPGARSQVVLESGEAIGENDQLAIADEVAPDADHPRLGAPSFRCARLRA